MIPDKPYEAVNKSHIQFRKEFVYLNALYYLVVSCKETLKQKLVDDVNRDTMAFGIVTHGISKSKFQGVFVYKNDAQQMANDFEGFINLTNQQMFVSSHRMLINYLLHLLKEAFELNLIKLKETDKKKLRNYSLSSKDILRIFGTNGINITKDSFETRQLKRLSATRNIIEHNNGVVDSEYIKLTEYDLNAGDQALTSSKEVGEALAITKYIVQYVNTQALDKWPELIA